MPVAAQKLRSLLGTAWARAPDSAGSIRTLGDSCHNASFLRRGQSCFDGLEIGRREGQGDFFGALNPIYAKSTATLLAHGRSIDTTPRFINERFIPDGGSWGGAARVAAAEAAAGAPSGPANPPVPRESARAGRRQARRRTSNHYAQASLMS